MHSMTMAVNQSKFNFIKYGFNGRIVQLVSAAAILFGRKQSCPGIGRQSITLPLVRQAWSQLSPTSTFVRLVFRSPGRTLCIIS